MEKVKENKYIKSNSYTPSFITKVCETGETLFKLISLI